MPHPDLDAFDLTPATTHAQPMDAAEFELLDDILADLRTRHDETPQWEFCEGFMAALVCCRRTIAPSEYLPALLGLSSDALYAADEEDQGSFSGPQQLAQFMALWRQRMQELTRALDAPVESLSDDAAYQPEMMDMRGAIASMSEAERADMPPGTPPSYGQIWALGFMYAVETWPEEWGPPRDRDAARLLDQALSAIVALTEDDVEPPTLCLYAEDGPPSVSAKRLQVLGEALWGVYDLRELWRSIGPRIDTVRVAPTPGRNDPCSCGSGKKYKKCCGM
jgi:uncharacterized protein